jgi:hypothetical protein
MEKETINALTSRLGTLQSDVSAMRRTIDAEQLAITDRQYLSRCFDLLDMELTAVRDFIAALANGRTL